MNQHTEFHAPATLRPLRDIVAEYEAKRDAAVTAAAEFKNAVTAAELAANIGGAYGGCIWGRSRPHVSDRDIAKVLLKSAWKHVYEGLNIGKIAPIKDRKQFEVQLENPPEFTLENLAATFGEYLKDPRFHVLRGLAECFCDLDMSYKSHSKVKIGVEGLPKRIIIGGAAAEYSYASYGEGKLRDVIRVLQRYRGEPDFEYGQYDAMIKEAKRHGESDWPGGTVKAYRNGNVHVIFDKQALLDINRALAEFYGEVLPDAEPEDAERDLFRQASTEVSKDLAYYPTPRKVVDEIMSKVSLDARYDDKAPAPVTILEPSCGDGQMIDGIIAYAANPDRYSRRKPVSITGVEVHADRAQEARAKGYNVVCGNFLDTAPDPRFDYVIMNPPFSGQHWKKHLTHARKFLKPRRVENDRTMDYGGTLICILPASAFYDGHLSEMGLVRKDAHLEERGWRDTGWHDLPVASFAASGTNVPTGYLVIGAK